MKAVMSIFLSPDEWYWATPQGCELIRKFIAEVVAVLGKGTVLVYTSDVSISEAAHAGGGLAQVSENPDPLQGLDDKESTCVLNFRMLHAPLYLEQVQAVMSDDELVATVVGIHHHPCQSYGLVGVGEIGHVFPLIDAGDYVCLQGCEPHAGVPDEPGFYMDSPDGWLLSSPSAINSSMRVRVSDSGARQVLLHKESLPVSEGKQLVGLSWPWSKDSGVAVWRSQEYYFLEVLDKVNDDICLFVNSAGRETIMELSGDDLILPEYNSNTPFFYSLLSSSDYERPKSALPVLSQDNLWWLDRGNSILDGKNGQALTGRQSFHSLYEVDNACLAGSVEMLRLYGSSHSHITVHAVEVSSQDMQVVDSSLSFIEACREGVDDILRERIRKDLKTTALESIDVISELEISVEDSLYPLKQRNFEFTMGNLLEQTRNNGGCSLSQAVLLQKTVEQFSEQADKMGNGPTPIMVKQQRLWEGHHLGAGVLLEDHIAYLDSYVGQIGVFDRDFSHLRTIDLPFDAVCDFDVDETGEFTVVGWPFTVARGPEFGTALFDEETVGRLNGVDGVTHVSRMSVSNDMLALNLRGSKRFIVYSLNDGETWHVLSANGLGDCCDLAWWKGSLFVVMETPSIVCRFEVVDDRLSLGAMAALPCPPGQIEVSEEVLYVHSSLYTCQFGFDLKRRGKFSLAELGIDCSSLLSSGVTAYHQNEGHGLYFNSRICNTVAQISFQD